MRALLSIVGCVVLVAQLHAQPAPSEADRLFEEGRTLAKAGKYVEACERFARSYELERTIGTALNLADCHEKQGHLPEAWQLFDNAAVDAERSGDDKRAKFAHERAALVASKLVTLVVKIAEPERPGIAVTVGGRTVPAAPEVRERVAPGDIAVAASVPGKPPFQTTAHGSAGATVVVQIPAFTDRPVPPPVDTGTGRRNHRRVVLAFGIAGGGGAVAIAALAISLKARSDYNATADGAHCMHVAGGIVCDDTGDRAIASAQRLADVGTGFAIASAALLATSAIVYVTAPHDVVVSPTATATSVGVALARRF